MLKRVILVDHSIRRLQAWYDLGKRKTTQKRDEEVVLQRRYYAAEISSFKWYWWWCTPETAHERFYSLEGFTRVYKPASPISKKSSYKTRVLLQQD